MQAQQIIKQLKLEAHPEGGYFRRSFTHPQTTGGGSAQRPLMSSIYYLLTADSATGYLHRNRSGILHFWQGGSPLHYTLLKENGDVEHLVMGPDLEKGSICSSMCPADGGKPPSSKKATTA